MANTVKIRRSGTTTSTPSSLDHGELAINYADDTLFWKDAANVIQSFVFQAYASATHKSSHATGGSDALTPSDIGAAPAASPTFTGTATLTPTGAFSAGYLTQTGDGIYLSSVNATDGLGSFGAAISWSRLGNGTVRSAAVAPVQTGADSDLVGLAFFVHSSTSASADIQEAVRIDASGNLLVGTTTASSLLTVNGVITVSAGTAAAPAIVSGTGTSDSGIFWPAADTVAISTAGSERVRVDASGRVGIGTTNPLSSLSVISGLNTVGARVGTATTTDIHRLTISATGSAFYQMKDDSNTITVVIAAAGNTYFNGGNVGIGTITPNNRLSVVGQFSAGNVERIPNNSGAAGFYDRVEIGGGTQATKSYGSLWIYNSSNSQTHQFHSFAGTDNYINNGGKLGVNTASPASTLHVNGVITVSATSGSAGSYLPSLCFASDANTGLGQVGGADSVSLITAGSERLRVDSSGTLTTYGLVRWDFPAKSLDSGVTDLGYLRVYDESNGVAGLGVSTASFNLGTQGAINMRFVTNTTERAIITSAGNVGIGTPSPTALLDINADTIRLRTARTPASASAAGNAGDICWDADFVYICTATNTWRKAAITADGSPSIANDSITYAKIQNVSATDRLLGRSSAGAGDVQEITCTAFGRSLIDDVDAAAARGTLGAAPTASPTFTGTTTFNGPVKEGYVPGGNTGTAKTIALTNGTLQDYTLTGNCTFTLPSASVGLSFTLILRTGGGGFTAAFTGSSAIRWPGGVAPTATTAENKLDIYTFMSDGGKWYGAYQQNYAD